MSIGLVTYTLIHVALSLVGIGAGFVVLFGFIRRQHLEGWTVLFLASTLATSLTGFGFPFVRFLPAHAVGIVSLVVIAGALFARYRRHLAGPWSRLYVIAAVTALYLNVVVAIAQAFRRVPWLNALAPTQSELPFLIAQLVVLVGFAALGIAAAKGFEAATVVPAEARIVAGA